MIGIEVEPPNFNPFVVIVWYRPPSEPISCFESLHENSSFVDSEEKEVSILGATNCDFCHREMSPSHIVKLRDLFGMTQIINFFLFFVIQVWRPGWPLTAHNNTAIMKRKIKNL